ncbi:MAG: DNA repair protein RecN [Terriglobales bacterium]
MLATLQIENYALIDQVSMEFGPGFNVLTGETGSGKSIIVDALGLLLGERADTAAIRSGAEQAAVTGSFASPFPTAAAAAYWCSAHGLSELGPEIRLRREIAANGRSRAFVDHQLATLAVLRELAATLGEIHSQNEVLTAFTPASQLRLLDRFATTEAGAETGAEALGAAFAGWRELSERLLAEQLEEQARSQQAELWRFQAQEIDAVRPQPGEDAALDQERQVLANAGRILAAAEAAYAGLYDAPDSAGAQLKAALRQLGEWQRFDASVAPLAARLEAARAEAADVAGEIRGLAERIEAAPGRLAEVEDRLAALDRLKRKHGPALEQVLAHRAELGAQLDRLENAGVVQAEAAARASAAAAEYRRLAGSAARLRRAAAQRLRQKLEAEVTDLAMPLRFEVEFDQPAEIEPAETCWGAAGWDRIRFLASTNPGEPLLPVAEIASGGERSRLLLALHLVAEGKARPAERGRTAPPRKTLVLDEIDAGIGGRAAGAVGKKLQSLGQHYQVLCVTHLPPIATFASHHLRVEKRTADGRTRTEVVALAGEERVAEVARMLAGNQLDPTSLRHAQELLAANRAGGH